MKTKKPYLAVLLSLFLPGFGHLYTGEIKKGAFLILSCLAVGFVTKRPRHLSVNGENIELQSERTVQREGSDYGSRLCIGR